MAELTKQALKVANNTEFPNNNNGAITPSNLRGFNLDMIDSTVNQAQYTTDSGSWNQQIDALESFSGSTAVSITNLNASSASQQISINNLNSFTASASGLSTGSLLVTASAVSNVITFTKGDASTFNVTVADTTNLGPLNTFTASAEISITNLNASSASQQVSINNLNTTTASLLVETQNLELFSASALVSISNLNASSASQQISINALNAATSSYVTSAITASSIITASVTNDDITFTKGDGSQFTIQVATGSFALSSSFAETASIARNLEIIARNGNASTLGAGTVVHITGASGDNPIFNTASFDTELLSANTLGLLRYSSVSGADVQVIVNGIVVGVNTDPALGYAAGDVLYLSSSGQFTKVQPQAPNQIVVLGQVLRAQQNNGSIYVSINNGWELNELHNVQINGVQTGDLLQYESSSYGLWKNKSIAGAGITTTSSFNSYTSSTNISVSNLNSATSSLFTSTSLGLTTASVSGTTMTFTKGNGTTFNVTLPTGSGGGTIDTGSFATTGSNTFVGNQTISHSGGASFILSDDSGITATYGQTGIGNFEIAQSGSVVMRGNGATLFDIIATASFVAAPSIPNITSDLKVNGTFTSSLQQGYVWVGNASGVTTTVATSSFGGGGSTFPFTGNAVITGSLTISSSASLPFSNTNGTSVQYFGNSFGSNIGVFKVSDATEIGLALDGAAWTTNWANGPIIYVNNTPGDTYEGVFGFQNKTNYTDGRITALKRLDVSGSVNIQNTLTASLQQGYVWVGDAAGRTTTVATSSLQTSIPSGTISGSGQITALGFATTGSNTFNGNQIINGLTTINVGAAGTETQKDFIVVTGSVINSIPFTNVVFGLQDYQSFGDNFKDAFVLDYWDSLSYNYGAAYEHNGIRTGTELLASGSGNASGGKGYGINQLRVLGTGSFLNQYASVINIGSYAPSTTDYILIGHNALPYLQLSSLRNQITGSTIISGSNGLQLTGSLSTTGTFTSSLQQGYVWVGDASGRTTTVPTSSFGGGGAAFPFTGDAVITGSLLVSGSAIPDVRVIGNVHITGSLVGQPITLSVSANTASIDMNAGNNFILTLPSSSVTHIVASSIIPGQTINLLIKQQIGPATGSITFAPSILFPSGLDMQATATGSAIDLVSMISFDTTNLMAANVKNLR